MVHLAWYGIVQHNKPREVCETKHEQIISVDVKVNVLIYIFVNRSNWDA